MMIAQITRYAMAIPPPPELPGASERSRGAMAISGARILVVEDDYLIAMIIEDTLLRAGHEILGVVATGEEAVQQGAVLRPDLVLMDIRLAGQMTGIEAAVELREKGIPSLFASAHTDQGTRTSGEEAKPVGWLAKPFSNAEIVSAVETALAGLRH